MKKAYCFIQSKLFAPGFYGLLFLLLFSSCDKKIQECFLAAGDIIGFYDPLEGIIYHHPDHLETVKAQYDLKNLEGELYGFTAYTVFGEPVEQLVPLVPAEISKMEATASITEEILRNTEISNTDTPPIGSSRIIYGFECGDTRKAVKTCRAESKNSSVDVDLKEIKVCKPGRADTDSCKEWWLYWGRYTYHKDRNPDDGVADCEGPVTWVEEKFTYQCL